VPSIADNEILVKVHRSTEHWTAFQKVLTEFCTKVMKKRRGKVVTLWEKPSTINCCQTEYFTVFTAFNVPFQWVAPFGPKFDANPDHYNALIRFYSLLSKNSNILPLPLEIMDGGFPGIIAGLDKLRHGRVSGQKLVSSFVRK
jgi:hypothetical protein